MSMFRLNFINPVDAHMFPTNLIDIIVPPLGLERFDLVSKGIHHRTGLLNSAVNLVLYIRFADTVQRSVLECGD